MVHDYDHAANACNQIHRAAHAFDQLAGDHPVGEVAVFSNFHRAKDRHGDFATADHCEAVRGAEIAGAVQFGNGLFTGVNQICVDFVLFRERAHAEHAVFGLQCYVHALGDVV